MPDGEEYVRTLLRLDDDLDTVLTSIENRCPDDSLFREAVQNRKGLRVVNDPFFPCLISFICSSQMRVERIHEMQAELASRFGCSITIDRNQYDVFPSPSQLAHASKEELQDAGLGYRARYVAETSQMIADEGWPDPKDDTLEQARDQLKRFTGVGNKVADCVLLFSCGYLQSVPLDTWVKQAIEEYYPQCQQGQYEETSRAIRSHWGDYAGYAQAYVFSHLRTREG